ncbi:MAG TPA: STAS domain-containing protein [Actinocrinis sp.]|jgi:anti-sigma B factor antagonist
MDRFTVSVATAERGGTVVAAVGELDMAAAQDLWRELEPRLVGGARVVLDGTGLTFLDSSGLRILLQAVKVAAADGADFRIVAPQPAIQRVFDLAGVGERLPLRASVQTAFAD